MYMYIYKYVYLLTYLGIFFFCRRSEDALKGQIICRPCARPRTQKQPYLNNILTARGS